MGADEDNCFVFCLDSKTGKLVWKTDVGRASKRRDYNQVWGEGPRSTPTVDGDQVFALTDLGVLAALDKESGDVLWSVDFVDRYGSAIPKWGYSESPLVDGDRVVVTPGGEKLMVGLDRRNGEEVWFTKGVNETAHYVSPIKGKIDALTFYVTACESGLMAFNASSGELLFSEDSTGNEVAVVTTPILDRNLLYHTSAYGAGNTLLELSVQGEKVKAKQRYHLSGKTMRNHHGGVVLVEGVIYGFTKIDGGQWMAQDFETGDVLWRERIGRNSSGSICYADGRLYCYNDVDGTCYLVKPNREGWNPAGKVSLPEQTKLERDKGAIWAHPIVADQTLFIRDQDLIFAFDIAAKKK
jgi:outer membrane protein assembly factor BamB